MDQRNLADLYGLDPIPWSRALKALESVEREKNDTWFLATTRPDGRPHVAGVGAIWDNDKVYVVSGEGTRKSQNLARNPNCAVGISKPGIDLVIEQIRIAAGAPLTLKQEDIRFNGHAIECRINAEDPRTFRPSPGKITQFHPPGGLGVRVDSGAYAGYTIPPYYDSLIGKLIVHARTRNECLMRLKRALGEFVVDGIDTTIPLFKALIAEPDIADGQYDIHWLENYLA